MSIWADPSNIRLQLWKLIRRTFHSQNDQSCSVEDNSDPNIQSLINCSRTIDQSGALEESSDYISRSCTDRNARSQKCACLRSLWRWNRIRQGKLNLYGHSQKFSCRQNSRGSERLSATTTHTPIAKVSSQSERSEDWTWTCYDSTVVPATRSMRVVSACESTPIPADRKKRDLWGFTNTSKLKFSELSKYTNRNNME